MKKLLPLFMLSALVFSCVDDFDEANDPRLLDGPHGYAAIVSGDAINSAETSGTSFNYVPEGGDAVFVIDMVDVPGLIEDVQVTLSNSLQPEDLGTVSIDFASAKGQTSGTITVTYTAGNIPNALTFARETFSVVVIDAQDKSITFPYDDIKILDGDLCFASRNLVGFYDASTTGTDSENGGAAYSVDAVIEFRINSVGSSVGNHPGYVRLTDGSFGLYPLQGFSNNFINVEVCGNNILSANEEWDESIGGSFTGTLNDDGTIDIDWVNFFGDTGSTTLTPQ